MILEPKHKNFKDEYKIKERVKKKINIRRNISVLVANEQHYCQKLLNWWHSPFKGTVFWSEVSFQFQSLWLSINSFWSVSVKLSTWHLETVLLSAPRMREVAGRKADCPTASVFPRDLAFSAERDQPSWSARQVPRPLFSSPNLYPISPISSTSLPQIQAVTLKVLLQCSLWNSTFVSSFQPDALQMKVNSEILI
jgi:hypothetical protein